MRSKSILSALLVVIAVLFGTSAYAVLEINTDFDSGSIGTYEIDEDNNSIDFTLRTETLVNTGSDYTYWMNFKVSDTLGRTITFRITNASDVPFLTSTTNEAQLVYSCDGVNWDRLTAHSYSAGTYTFTETFTCDEVQIATFFPFSYTKMSDFVNNISASPWAGKAVLGSSAGSRDIDLLTITNTTIPLDEKEIVYIIGRQHAGETASSHMLEGLIDFLISDDVYACGLRNHYVWHIVPMVNPDGVFLGNSRATSELRDPNRDWGNTNSVEISTVRMHIESIEVDDSIDFFIDWHSQMNDVRWYNFLYSPSNNTFFSVLADWTDFDSQSASGASSCTSSSCSSRGFIMNNILYDPTFILEPTPHLATWTKDSLNAEGVNTAFAINDHFGWFEGPLLVDSGFDFPTDSADLKNQGPGRSWYESRDDDPSLLSLDEIDIGGNAGKKAKFTASALANAYVTQRFGWPQGEIFAVRWQVYVDSILDDADRDRSAMMLIGDGGGTADGPNSTGSERFVYMAFYSSGGGGDDPSDTMSLIASEPGDPFDDSSQWRVIASGLSFDTWHTINVVSNLTSDTYDVYIDDSIAPVATVAAYSAKSSLTHISFAHWAEGAGTFYVDDVKDGSLPVFAMELGRTDCSGSCLGDANSDNDVDGADIAELIAKLAQAECC